MSLVRHSVNLDLFQTPKTVVLQCSVSIVVLPGQQSLAVKIFSALKLSIYIIHPPKYLPFISSPLHPGFSETASTCQPHEQGNNGAPPRLMRQW